MKEAISLLVIVVILACSTISSRPAGESNSTTGPSTSITADALRADPVRASAVLDAATKNYESLLAGYRARNANFHELYPASKRWMEIEVHLAANEDEISRAVARHGSRMKARLEQLHALARAKASKGPWDDFHAAHSAVAEAEKLLLKAGGKVTE